MVFVEKSFPRGGVVKPHTFTDSLAKDTEIIFGAKQDTAKKPKDKKKRKEAKQQQTEKKNEEQLGAISADSLNFKTISEGMIIMGCIKTIEETALIISLPGRIFGKVPVTSISKSYLNMLKKFVNQSEMVQGYKPLDEMFTIGQIVYCKVIELILEEDTNTQLILSLNPSEIHSELYHENITKGCIISGAVEDIEDHGYIIETGIKNLRAFLPETNFTLGIGEIVSCIVEKAEQQKAASTVILKSFKNHEIRKLKMIGDVNLNYILPSVVTKFTVTKILKNGLQGTVFNGNFMAFVNEHQLSEPTQKPDEYEVNKKYDARVLYVTPLTKSVYLSLNLDQLEESNQTLPIGTVIKDAEILRVGTGAVSLKLDDGVKGLITSKGIKSGLKSNYDVEDVMAKYLKNKTIKVRVVSYNMIDHLYLVTDDERLVNEKYFSINDVQPGDFVEAKLIKKLTDGGFFVVVGNVKGILNRIDLSASSVQTPIGATIKTRVISIDSNRNLIHLTNCSEYMLNKAKFLSDWDMAVKDGCFVGTVVKEAPTLFLIRFFNGIKGIFYKDSKYHKQFSLYEGKIEIFKIFNIINDGTKIILTTPNELDDNAELGEFSSGLVSLIYPTGLEVTLKKNKTKGQIPNMYLSENPILSKIIYQQITEGVKLKFVNISKDTYSVRDVDYYKENPINNFNDLKIGDIVRCFVKNVTDSLVQLLCPLKDFNKFITVHVKMLLEGNETTNIVLVPDQIIYVKVLDKNQSNKNIVGSALLSTVWNGDLKESAKIMETYLNDVKKIHQNYKESDGPLGNYDLGQKVKGKITQITGKMILVQLKGGITGIIDKFNFSKETKKELNDKIECTVIWFDFIHQTVYLTARESFRSRIAEEQTIIKANSIKSPNITGDVILITEDVTIVCLKKPDSPLVFIPKRFHYNDFLPIISTETKLGQCKIIPLKHNNGFVVGMFKIIYDRYKKITFEDLIKKRKIKIEDDVVFMKKIKLDDTNDCLDVVIKEEDLELNDFKEELKTQIISSKKRKSVPIIIEPKSKIHSEFIKLPGANDFWNLETKTQEINDTSSDDDSDNETSQPEKKKKLTAAERFEVAQDEEKRIRKIEENLASSDSTPESPDHFDRLVLANPNSSLTWINYMVFHLQATEIDKARAIARKALKSISFREELELLNVWVALLNLEIRYGNKESFDDCLKEALQVNDPFKVHTRCLEILADCKKTEEVSDMIIMVTKKFKSKPEVWPIAAAAYFEVGLGEKAKQLLHKALKSLEQRDHVQTIVQFAFLNNKYGQKDTAHALLEQVLTSYPKRVDVWSQYVDLLIKDQRIDVARQILNRAVAQVLPIKKMKTLFKKYLEFEQKHGDESNVQKVKEMAAEYVRKEVAN